MKTPGEEKTKLVKMNADRCMVQYFEGFSDPGASGYVVFAANHEQADGIRKAMGSHGYTFSPLERLPELQNAAHDNGMVVVGVCMQLRKDREQAEAEGKLTFVDAKNLKEVKNALAAISLENAGILQRNDGRTP